MPAINYIIDISEQRLLHLTEDSVEGTVERWVVVKVKYLCFS